MNIRLLIVQFSLLLMLGLVWLLPESPPFKLAAVEPTLPLIIGDLIGESKDPTDEELEILAQDTKFSKMSYTSLPGASGWFEGIEVSIVRSGRDLNNSIHRPERCLPAQGYKDLAVSRRSLLREDGSSLKVKRIRSYREFEDSAGKMRKIYNLNYYWFVGHHSVTESHYERTFIDMRDRLLRGYNQQWAYFTIAGNITAPLGGLRSEEMTDAMIQNVIKAVYSKCVKADQLSN